MFFFQRLDALISEEEKRCMLKCEGIRGFHEELYNIGFLLVINWMSWLNQNEIYKNRANDIEEPVMKADLDTLRKLMIRYIRGDIQRHGYEYRRSELLSVPFEKIRIDFFNSSTTSHLLLEKWRKVQ